VDGWSTPRPGRFTPGITRYPLYRRLGGPQGLSGRVWKISPTPGLDPRTPQLVASRYIDYAIPDHSLLMKINANRDYWCMCETETTGISVHNTKFVVILAALFGLCWQWQLAVGQERQWVESMMTLEPLRYQYWLRAQCHICIVSSGRLHESPLSLLHLACHIITPFCVLLIRIENDGESKIYCDSKSHSNVPWQ